ncbi:MAG: Bug family tripartite tricarboxylate transporter substrate binding protein [Beijerinckiaceae bacterium]
MKAGRGVFAKVLCAAIGLGAAAGAVQAQPFYEGKTVNLIIGYGPGAGYDAYGRLVARHMGRHIPGNPALVPQNMPGAGSMKAAGYLYSVAPKDGTVFGIFATAAALEPLYTGNKSLFDPAKFTWIGNLDETIGTCAVWHTAGIAKFEDMRAKEVIFGGSGPAAINSQHAAALKNLLGMKIRIIQGYNGALDTRLVMPRGELQGGCGFALSSLLAQHTADYRDKRLIPIVQLAIEKNPELEGVAHVYDYATTDEMRQIFDLVFGSHVLGRPFAAPPAIPDERKKILRTAFMATASDPQFLAEAEKARLPIKASDGEKVEKLFERFLSSPPDVVAKAAKAIRD